MRWEQLTDSDFARAVRETGLCIVPVGCLERHSDHLPLGTDMIASHAVASRAAEREPAVVFPPYCFGQINEARHFAGALTLPPPLLSQVLGAVCDEIGRNGFRKILLYDGHGGNTHWLRYFCQCALYERKPYTVYLAQWPDDPERRARINAICPTNGEHAHEEETCLMLALAPDLVKMDRVPDQPGVPLGRLKDLRGAYTGIWWYADYPEHYSGDARGASKEKARRILEIHVEALAETIRSVKEDRAAPALEREFFDRVDKAGNPPGDSAG